jgi:hypothetical protein
MQNREELRQKGHAVLQDGEKYLFHKGGINIVFRPKYRPVGPGQNRVGQSIVDCFCRPTAACWWAVMGKIS